MGTFMWMCVVGVAWGKVICVRRIKCMHMFMVF